MPVEIRELHIKVTVNPADQAGAAVATGAAPGDEGGRDAIVAECVEQVLRILHARKER